MRRDYDPKFDEFVSRVEKVIHRAKIAGIAFAVVWGILIYFFLGEIEARRADRAAQIDQLCTAVPNAAAAGAQALIDVIVTDAERRHLPPARIADTRRLGALYVARARYLTVQDLTTCPGGPR